MNDALKSFSTPGSEDATDEALLVACRDGSSPAWEHLLARYQASFARWIPRSVKTSAPLVSRSEIETFVGYTVGFVALRIRSFRPGPEGTGRGWLRRVVRSAAGEFRRELRARVRFQAELDPDAHPAADGLDLSRERGEGLRVLFAQRLGGMNARSWLAAKLVYAFVEFVGEPTEMECRDACVDRQTILAALAVDSVDRVGRQGLSIPEVARLLAMKANHVHQACHRVRQAVEASAA